MVEIYPVNLPKFSANDESGVIVEWVKPVGEYVKKGEVICSIESTKSIFEVEAPNNGYLTIIHEAGSEARVGESIAAITTEAVSREEIDAWLSQRTAVPATNGNGDEPSDWTVKAKVLAQREGIKLDEFPALGRKITEGDVIQWIQSHQPAKKPQADHQDLMDGIYPAGRVQRLLIIGGGDGAVQILDVLAKTPGQRAVAIADDNPSLQGKTVGGVPVTGGIQVDRLVDLFEKGEFDAAIISISTIIKLRAEVFDKLKSRGVRFANVIHPSAVIGSNVSMGEGNVIMAFSHIGACATIGNNNFISAYCSIEHHNTMGNHCSFGPGVVTSSRVKFGDRVRCGTGIFIEPKITIGAEAVIGSGCILWNNVPERSVLKSKLNYVERIRTG